MESVAFLGHVVSKEGKSIDLKKVEVVSNWPRHTSMTKFRNFLNYYRFVKYFSKIAAPLTKLTQKQIKF